jgi:hypothetical protein
VFESVVGVDGAVTTIVIVELAPAASEDKVQLVAEVPLQVHPLAVRDWNVVPAGIVSVRVRFAAGTPAELFVTVIVYVNVPPVVTGSGLSVFVIDRSATLTSVAAVAVLFPLVLSLGDETVALFVIDPAEDGAVAVIVILGASAPAARFPPVRLHVTVPLTLLQLQFVPDAPTNVVPAGRVSTTFTAEASSGPAL